MSKQLLLGEIELDIYEWSNDRAETAVGSIEEKYCDYHLKLLDKYKKLVNQLDEPKKVIVPKFVAEWIEEHCYMGKYVCLETFMCQYNDVDLPTELYNYYDNNRDDARDKVISAILNGYEVEKEPRWVIKVGNMYFINWGEDGCTPSFVLNDILGQENEIPKWFSKESADKIAKQLGGTAEWWED